jgi:ssDNA-binding Zn-finger/Zn-ribbon topoisomerase 1
MIEREGKYGTFLGCLSYPQCTNTKKIKIDSFKINQMDKI